MREILKELEMMRKRKCEREKEIEADEVGTSFSIATSA